MNVINSAWKNIKLEYSFKFSKTTKKNFCKYEKFYPIVIFLLSSRILNIYVICIYETKHHRPLIIARAREIIIILLLRLCVLKKNCEHEPFTLRSWVHFLVFYTCELLMISRDKKKTTKNYTYIHIYISIYIKKVHMFINSSVCIYTHGAIALIYYYFF